MVKQPESIQITLKPDQTQVLSLLARQKGQTIIELVEEIIQETVDLQQKKDIASRLEALEQVKQHKQAILAERGGQPLSVDLVGLLQEMREERDHGLFTDVINYANRH